MNYLVGLTTLYHRGFPKPQQRIIRRNFIFYGVFSWSIEMHPENLWQYSLARRVLKISIHGLSIEIIRFGRALSEHRT